MTNILVLDTATEACSAALLHDGQLSFQYELAPQAHTRKILPMCSELLQEAGLELTALDAIAFGQGPGSFTGVRIGIGVAQGLAFGAQRPLIGVSNLAALAQGCWRRQQARYVMAAIDARMNEIYFAAFVEQAGVMTPLCDEEVLAPEVAQQKIKALLEQEPGRWWACGTGFAAYPELHDAVPEQLALDTEHLPDARDMLPLAVAAWQEGKGCAPELATPVYLRDKVTWKKLPGRE